MLNSTAETVVCDECGDRHWAYEECPCLDGEWPEAHEYEGVDGRDVAWMDEVSESPPPSPKKKAKPLQQPPESPLSMKILGRVGPQQQIAIEHMHKIFWAWYNHQNWAN